MRYVTIPADVTILAKDEKGQSVRLPVKFEQLLCEGWLNHASFGQPLSALHRNFRLRDAFRWKQPGDVVVLDEADWAPLANVVKNESCLHPQTAILIYEKSPEMFSCITDAPNVDPGL